MIYFDNAATARLHPAVQAGLMNQLVDFFANPSSLHHEGLRVSRQVETIRSQVAKLASAKPSEVIFTSGGTEANNLALQGVLQPGDHVIISAIEHASVRSTASHLQGVEVTEVTDITVDGILAAIQPNTKLVSIMLVNNETGQIFRLDGLHKELTKRGILFHRDAVQAYGKLPMTPDFDLLTLSGHKLGAIKGIGGLIVKSSLKLHPLTFGGDQERTLRPGTENTPGILSLGLVLTEEANLMTERFEAVTRLNQHLKEQLRDEAIILSEEDASPYILSLSFPGIPSEILLNAMSAKQMYFSAGSACSSRSKHKSHVIVWLTDDEVIRSGAFRVSFSWQNTMAEVETFANELLQTVNQLRKVIR